MYKVIDCGEDCVLTVVDIEGKDKYKYYADMNIGDVFYIDDDGNRNYVPVGSTLWDRVKFPANVYWKIDNRRLYYSVYDHYVLYFISYARNNLHLDTYYVVKIFSPYFNLIESYSKILSKDKRDNPVKVFIISNVYNGLLKMYKNNVDLETVVPQYFKDIFYIHNNTKFISAMLEKFYCDYKKTHLLKKFVQSLKQMNYIDDINNNSIYFSLFIMSVNLLIFYNKDSYIKIYINIIKSIYLYKIYNDNFNDSNIEKKLYLMFKEYIEDCEQKDIYPRVNEKIIEDLYNDKIIHAQEKIDGKIAAVAGKYNWVEEFEYAGYAAYVMKGLDDFRVEAKHQNNCVARNGYDKKMANEESIICSLRKEDDWITCEFNGVKILQMFGKNNTKVDEGIKQAFQDFIEIKFEKLT